MSEGKGEVPNAPRYVNIVSLTEVKITEGRRPRVGVEERDLGFDFEHVGFEVSYWIANIYLGEGTGSGTQKRDEH